MDKIKNYFCNQTVTTLVWLLFEHSTVIVCNLVTNIMLARFLGVSEYGVLATSLAFTLLFLPFFQCGLNTIVTKEILNDAGDRKVVTNALVIRLLFSFVFSCVALVILSYLPELNQSRPLIWILLVGQFFLSFAVSEFWFHARHKARVFAVIRSCTLLFFCLIKIYAVYIGAELRIIVLLYALENILIGLISFTVFYFSAVKVSAKIFSISYSTELIKKSGWLLASAFAAMIYLKIDQLMIIEMLNKREAGIYSVASRLSEISYFLPSIISIALFPNLLSMVKENSDGLYFKIRQYFSILFYLGLSISIFVTLISRQLITILFGSEYEEAYAVLNIHIWACIFIFMRALVSKLLVAFDLYHYSLISHGVGAVINVLLNLILIPRFGIVGAAYATLVSYFVASVLIFAMSKKTRFFFKQMLMAPIFWSIKSKLS